MDDDPKTDKVLKDYMRVKSKLMKRKRVFDDVKIATLDAETELRSNLVAKLLGGSKEALDIQEKFKKMVEVPSEEFNLKNFKDLQSELKVKVQRPAAQYEKSQWMNAKHLKNFSSIEDFVTVQPVTTNNDSMLQNSLYEASISELMPQGSRSREPS